MSRFQDYLSSVDASQSILRLIAGISVIVGFWIACNALLLFTFEFGSLMGIGFFSNFERDFDPISSIGEIFLMLIMIACLWGGIWISQTVVHRQKFNLLFSKNPGVHQKIQRAWIFVGSVAVLILAPMLITIFSGTGFPGLSPETFVRIFPFLAVLVFLQSGAEELFFRGYLLQQIAARNRSWIAWALLPSLLFGFLHYDPGLGSSERFIHVYSTTVFGLLTCGLVFRTGSLWPSIILHFINNLLAFSIIGVDGFISGTQLWIVSMEEAKRLLPYDAVFWTVLLAFVISPTGRWLDPDFRSTSK